MNDFLTVAEIAIILKLSERTIRRYIKIGRIRAFRIGNSQKSVLRISEKELERIQRIGFEENMEALRQEYLED